MKIKAFKEDGSFVMFVVSNPCEVMAIDSKFERWEWIV